MRAGKAVAGGTRTVTFDTTAPARWRVAGGALARVALLMLVLGPSAGCARRHEALAGPAPELWFYQIANLSEHDCVARIAPLWRRAARAGYRRVVLADHKFGRLADMRPAYFEHAAELRHLADSLGLSIVPGIYQVGRSGALLAGDPNLVEALPVAGVEFVVTGGIARPHRGDSVTFSRRPSGSDWGVRVDSNHVATRRCLWRARWWYDVRVHPAHAYHVSWWLRTEDFAGDPRVWVFAGRRRLHFMSRVSVTSNQEWTRYDLMFNSLDYTQVRVTFGVRGRTRGLLEWRDWGIEEAGPVNIVRRPDAPFALHDAVTGVPLVEGRDFAAVSDPWMGRDPWPGEYSEWHESPAIRVSRPDGTRLIGSWHHAAVVGGKQVTCCLSEAGTWARLEDEARRMQAVWGRGRYLMMFDEIRALGGDSACIRTGQPAGALLANAVRRCAALLPADTLYVWGDMFDPRQNATGEFYLVRGSLEGSVQGLGSRVGVVNWNEAHARESLRFFAARGHAQVIAGYYDGSPGGIRNWIEASRGVPGVEAVLYTTWRNRYDDLETFAGAVHSLYR